MWPGQGMSLQVKEVLFQGKSDFQVWHCNLQTAQLQVVTPQSPDPSNSYCLDLTSPQDVCVFESVAYGTVLLLDGTWFRWWLLQQVLASRTLRHPCLVYCAFPRSGAGHRPG
jgi:hypothetical protein